MASLVDIYTAENTIKEGGFGLYTKQFFMSWKAHTLLVAWDVLNDRLMYNHYLEDDEVIIIENIIRKHLTNR